MIHIVINSINLRKRLDCKGQHKGLAVRFYTHVEHFVTKVARLFGLNYVTRFTTEMSLTIIKTLNAADLIKYNLSVLY